MNDPWGERIGEGVVGSCAKGAHDLCTGGVHVRFREYVKCSCECHRAKPAAAGTMVGVLPGDVRVVNAGDTFAAQATSEFGPGDIADPKGDW